MPDAPRPTQSLFPSAAELRGLDGRPEFSPQAARYLDRLGQSLSQLLEAVERRATARGDSDAQEKLAQIRAALEANGTHPLNVQNLRGQLSEPQTASAPTVTALPALSEPQYEDGALVAYAGVVYRRNRTAEPGSWDPVTNVGSVSTVSSSSTAPGLTLTTTNPTTTPSLALAGVPTRLTLGAKQTAGAPYANDGYVEILDQAGNTVRVMTTP